MDRRLGRPLPHQQANPTRAHPKAIKSLVRRHYPVLAPLSGSYSEPKGRFPRVTHPCATSSEELVRLACVRHAASVRSEPGSNSQVCVTHQAGTDRKSTRLNSSHVKISYAVFC